VARKGKNNTTENIDNSSFDTSFIKKLLVPLKVLIRIHVKIATDELKKDIARLVGGLRNIFMGLFFILFFWALLNVAAIFYLKDLLNFDKFLYSILIVAGINFIFGLLLFTGAILKFRKPFLKDTTQLIKDSINDIKKGKD
jgi:hypothetical protein